MDIMEELGICVDSFTDDIYIPTLEELCRMFGVNSLEELLEICLTVQWLSDINKKNL